MSSALLVVVLILVGLQFVAWIIPLVIGIVKLRRGDRTAGLVLTIVGGAWGALMLLAGIPMALVFGMGYYATRSTEFDATTYKGAQAAIVSTWNGPGELTYRRDKTRYRSRSKDGRYPVPAGELRLESLRLEAGQPAWSVRTTLSELAPLQLAGGAEQRLEAGPPLTVRARVNTSESSSSISLEYRDSFDHQAYITAPSGAAPAQFEVCDAAGRRIWSGKFSSG